MGHKCKRLDLVRGLEEGGLGPKQGSGASPAPAALPVDHPMFVQGELPLNGKHHENGKDRA
jgi:hypothetical protein